MSALLNSLAGILFLVVSLATTFLMFYLWKFPYDHETHASSAPRRLVQLHRILGVIYVIIYIYLMYQMVPRLWAYQIELPARTVFHLTLGMSIGAILIIKIAIVRFFKHMEAKLIPALGVSLTICTMLLIFLALPFSLREAYLRTTALEGDDMEIMERIERIREQLPSAGITEPALIDQLASSESLDSGRQVLMTKCTQCHDLRTVLARPRTPESWAQTVSRMANRSTILSPITEQDQLEVTSYLIAISPTLQKSLIEKRKQANESQKAQKSNMSLTKDMMSHTEEDMPYDPVAAQESFQTKCSQCHAYTQVEQVSLEDEEDVIALTERMIGNGLMISNDELSQIIRYLTETYTDEEPKDEEEIETDTESSAAELTGAGLNGEALFEQSSCEGCHGPQGASPLTVEYPKLTGQNKTYLIQQITDIRDGIRTAGLAAVMRGSVSNLTDEEIEAISEYLSGLNR